jgi:hypothetical protein
MVSAAISKFLRRGTNIADALAERRSSALEQWQRLVETAVAGKDVDVGELERVAVSLRISDVVASFEHDVDNCKARAIALETVARDEVFQREAAEKFAAAASEIWRARERVAQLERDLASMPAHAASVGFSQAEVRRLEEATPRMFAREILERKRIPSDPPISDEQVEQHAMNFKPRGALDNSFWDTTPGDD